MISVFKILHFIVAPQTFVYKSTCVCKILASKLNFQCFVICMESEFRLVLRPRKISTGLQGSHGTGPPKSWRRPWGRLWFATRPHPKVSWGESGSTSCLCVLILYLVYIQVQGLLHLLGGPVTWKPWGPLTSVEIFRCGKTSLLSLFMQIMMP